MYFRKKIRIIIFSLCFPIIALSYPGRLVEYNFQNTFSISIINIFLNQIGNSTSNVLYPTPVYDIKYESIDYDGEIDILSRLVSFPHSNQEVFQF